MKYILILISVLFLFSGCVTREPELKEFKKREAKPLELSKKINTKTLEESFNISKDDLKTRAKWFNRLNSLDLVIHVADNDDEVSKKLYEFLKKVQKDKNILDTLGSGNLSQKYKSIKVIKYSYGSEQSQRVDAAYTNRLFDKEILNDVLRDNTKTDYQELSISINTDELDDDKFMIEGYKSVKYTDKKLNSYYYQLVKNNISNVDENMIKNAVISALKLSIPEYVSINRNDIKSNKALKIVHQQEDGSYLGKAYKMKIDNAIDKLNKKREKELNANPKNVEYISAKYDKILETIKSSSKWIKYGSKQLLYTTPISQETINTLKEQKYIKEKYTADSIKIEQAKDISTALNIQLPDQYLTLSFPVYQHMLNQFEINIGEVNKMIDTYFIKSENQVNSDSSADISAGVKNTGTAIVNGFITTFAIMAKAQFNTMKYADENYAYVKPNIQSGQFYPTSKFIYDNIGIDSVYENNFGHFDHALFTIPAGIRFYVDTKNNELGLVDKEKNEVTIIDIKTAKQLRVIELKEAKDFLASLRDNPTGLTKEQILKTYNMYSEASKKPENAHAKIYYERIAQQNLQQLKKLENGNFPTHIEIIANTGGQGTSHGGACRKTIEFTKTIPVPIKTNLKSGIYLQNYNCSPFIDIFDKDGNFIKRNTAHGGYIKSISTLMNDKYIISQGQYSSKIWATEVFNFISKKF